MSEKCFTGDEFTTLIGKVGPLEAARQLIEGLERRITARNVRRLRAKHCIDPIDHAKDVTQMQYLATINELIRFHNGQKERREREMTIGYTNPTGYIYQIGNNLCDQHIRGCRFGEIPCIVSEETDFEHLYLGRTTNSWSDQFRNSPVERELYMKEQEQLLNEAFLSLKPARREAVRLKKEGYSSKEIANEMGLTSVDNARQLVKRGTKDIYTYVCEKIGGRL